MHTLNIYMKFDPKADPVLESGVKSFEINYFLYFQVHKFIIYGFDEPLEFE